MKGRYKPNDNQILGNELGFAGERQANTEQRYQEDFGGHKDLTIVEYNDRFYVCYGGDHKLAYKTFLSPAEIRALEGDDEQDS